MSEALALLLAVAALCLLELGCLWSAFQVQRGGYAGVSDTQTLWGLGAVIALCVTIILAVCLQQAWHKAKKAKQEARLARSALAVTPSEVTSEDPALASSASNFPPAAHSTAEAIDAALQTARSPPIDNHAELHPAVPADSHPEDSNAAEEAAFPTILGAILSSVPILNRPVQQDSMPASPAVSDNEPSSAAMGSSENLVKEPGADNTSSFSLMGNHTMQPSSVSTGMQQPSDADTIGTPQGSPTLQPISITSKAKGLRRVSSAFEGFKIKAFRKTTSGTSPVVAHTSVTAEPRSGCWPRGRRQARRNAGQGRKLIPTIFGRGCFG